MIKYNHPDWNKVDCPINLGIDNKFSYPSAYKFPGYVDNSDHPFTFCNSLTHEDPFNPHTLTNKWSGTDSRENFERNRQALGSSWRYYNKEITYDVNSSGFRTKEWKDINWKDSIVVIGCSCTYGVGLAEDETLCSILQEKTSLPVVNLGYPGGSNTLIANMCASMINKFTAPRAVIIIWSSADRFRYYFDNYYLDVGPWYSVENSKSDKIENSINFTKLWQYRYLDKTNELCENYYIAQTVQAMLKDRTQLITASFFDYVAHATRSDFYFKYIADDKARDLMHPGPNVQKDAVESILKLLK
jgi:hypothetical protein